MPSSSAIVAARGLLLGLFCVIPFQFALSKAFPPLGAWLSWLDEATLVLLGSTCVALRLRRVLAPCYGEPAIAAGIVFFVLCSASSALANHTGFDFFVLGTLDYLKGLAFAWIAASLVDRQLADRALKAVGFIALAAALWGLGESIVGTIWWVEPDSLSTRLGVWRARGPFGHPNLLGLYLLIAFAAEMTAGKRRAVHASIFALGAIAAYSRIVLAALIVIASLLGARRKVLWTFAAAAVALTLASSIRLTATEYGTQVWQEETKQREQEEATGERQVTVVYRTFVAREALEIWKSGRWLGVGAGRFGGVVSLKLDSPVYDSRPPWPHFYWSFFQSVHSLESFYPQLLAEVGILGAASFFVLGVLLLALLVTRWWPHRHQKSPEHAQPSQWAAAGALVLLIIPIYCLGSGLNQAPFLIPAMIVVGFGLAPNGAAKRSA